MMLSNKTERITVRLTKEQKEQIKIFAIKHNITVSDLFLTAMLKYIASEEKNLIDS